MNKFITFIQASLLIALLAVGNSAFALSTDVGTYGTGSGAVKAGGVNVSTGGNTSADANASGNVSGSASAGTNADGSASAGTNDQTNSNGSSGAGVNVSADGSFDLSQGQAAGVSLDAESAMLAPSAVTTSVDLSNYATAKLKRDSHIQNVSVSNDQVQLAYNQQAHFLGFIPASMKATATVKNSGAVDIHYPWYRFLFSVKGAADAKTALQAHVQEILAANGGVLTPTAQAEIIDAMSATLSGSASSAAASAGADVNATGSANGALNDVGSTSGNVSGSGSATGAVGY